MSRPVENSSIMPASQLASLVETQQPGERVQQGFRSLGSTGVDTRGATFQPLQPRTGASGAEGARQGFVTLPSNRVEGPTRMTQTRTPAADAHVVYTDAQPQEGTTADAAQGRVNTATRNMQQGPEVRDSSSTVAVLEHRYQKDVAVNGAAEENNLSGGFNVDTLMGEIERHLEGLQPGGTVHVTIPLDVIRQRKRETSAEASADGREKEGPLLGDLLDFVQREHDETGKPIALAVSVDPDGAVSVNDGVNEDVVDAVSDASDSAFLSRLRGGRRGADGGGKRSGTTSGRGSKGRAAKPPEGNLGAAGSGHGDEPPRSGIPTQPGGPEDDGLGEGKERVVIFDYTPYIPPSKEDMRNGEKFRTYLREKRYTGADRLYRRIYSPAADNEVEALEARKKAAQERRSTKQPMHKRALPWIGYGATYAAGEGVQLALEQLPPHLSGLSYLVYAGESVATIAVGINAARKNVLKDLEPPLVTGLEAANMGMTIASQIEGLSDPVVFFGIMAVASTEFAGMGIRLWAQQFGDSRAISRLNRHNARKETQIKSSDGTARKKGVESRRKSYENKFATYRAQHDQLLGEWQGSVVTVDIAEQRKTVLQELTVKMIKTKRKRDRYARKQARREKPISADKK